MKRSTLILLKAHLAGLPWPLGLLLWGAINNNLGADPTATITFATGLATLRLLTISLAITPLRRLSPRLGWLIKFRRLLGLFAFFYATLHLLTYVALYAGFDVNAMACRHRQAPLYHHRRGRMAAASAAGRDIDQIGPSASWAASAGIACTSWFIWPLSAE
jgi:DMSO/TMAO reductase YedYZ heme-binding membrane subunit